MIKHRCVVTHRRSLDAYDCQVWHKLRSNQYLPYCFDRERKEGRKKREKCKGRTRARDKERNPLGLVYGDALAFFLNCTSNRTHKHSQSSSKGYSKPRGTQVSDLFLVYGLKVRLDQIFSIWCQENKCTPQHNASEKKVHKTPIITNVQLKKYIKITFWILDLLK